MYSPLYCSSRRFWISSSILLKNHGATVTCVAFSGFGLTSSGRRFPTRHCKETYM
jgi:hypothetical protein